MRILAIVPEKALRQELEEQLLSVPSLELTRSLGAFPELDELLRTIRIQKPDFLIASVADLSKIEPILANLDDLMPGLPIVGIAAAVDPALAHKLVHLRIREYLETPITRAKLVELAEFLARQLKKHPSPVSRSADLYSFFPAKPGVGTTTIAVGVSCALADEFAARTLLLDCDLAAGIVNFHLKLGNSASIVDALSHGSSLDEDLWRQMVARRDKLEVLHAGGLHLPPPIPSENVLNLLAFARAQYEVVCADLPSEIDEFSIEMLRESRRIFLVTTPEVAPLHLAQVRLKAFNDLGLADRVSLILNRKDRWRGHLGSAEVEKAVGIPVAYCIGNDYQTVSDAVINAAAIPSATALGQSILALAQSLLPDPARRPIPQHPTRRFLEFFHVPETASHEDPTTRWQG
jgi:Flp pilus assembly CpaE family ATPase